MDGLLPASARRENLLNELKQINQNIYPFPLDVTEIDKCKLVASNIIINLIILIFVYLVLECMIQNQKKNLI